MAIQASFGTQRCDVRNTTQALHPEIVLDIRQVVKNTKLPHIGNIVI